MTEAQANRIIELLSDIRDELQPETTDSGVVNISDRGFLEGDDVLVLGAQKTDAE